MSEEERKKYAHEYYLRNREKMLKKQKDYYQRPGVRERQKEYRCSYYKINRETMRKQHKEYKQRPEVIAHQKTPEVKERRREAKRRYRQSAHGKATEKEYYLQRRKIDPDFWKKYYLAHREKMRESIRRYEATPEAKALKRKAEAKPERRAKKAAYTREYQAKPEVHEKRLAKSRYYKKTPKGREATRYQNERRRARKLSAPGSFTKEEWLKVRDATGGVCPFCGK